MIPSMPTDAIFETGLSINNLTMGNHPYLIDSRNVCQTSHGELDPVYNPRISLICYACC